LSCEGYAKGVSIDECSRLAKRARRRRARWCARANDTASVARN
jgi:hypothetical protein